ncbi:MAG: hypothetical protein HOW73_43705 [Polyangiaceae bacterium]|nr:hypothetical protein [Polyangiaceae bacterium]
MRGVSIGRFLTLTLACGCAETRHEAREVSPAAHPTIATAESTASPPSAAAPSALPKSGPRELTLEPPANIACSIASSAWTGNLQLREGGPVFATVTEVRTTLSIPQEKAAAFANVDAPLKMRGVVTTPLLFLAKPMLLGGFVLPRADTPLSAAGPHAEGRLSITLDLDELFSDPKLVAQELPCAAVATMPSSYDAASFVGAKGEADDVRFVDGTDLRTSAKGDPVARISNTNRVWVTAKAQSGAVRVVLEADRYYAVGWVPLSAVKQGLDLPELLKGGGGTGVGLAGYEPQLRCPRDLPVSAQMGGERARIGTLRKGERFIRADRQPKDLEQGEAAIVLVVPWLTMAPRAVLFTKEAELAGCKSY